MTRTTLGLSLATILAGLAIGCGGETPEPAASTPAASTPAASTPTASTSAASPAAGTPAAPKAASPAAGTPAASTPAASTPAASAAASTVTLVALEDGEKYTFDQATLTVKAGEVTVKLSNKEGNRRPHTFAVRDASGKELVGSARVQPGASADVKFTIAEAGQYTFYCNLMGHEDRGQKGTLTVVKG
jgi:plastocyanin